MSLPLLDERNIGTIARWLKEPTRVAAKLLLEAVVIVCKKSIEGQQNFQGCNQANLIPWIQALEADVTDAACLGLAIYTIGANPEDLAFLANHLEEGTMRLLVKPAETCIDPGRCRCNAELGHTSLHAMLVLERCTDPVRIQSSFGRESLIPCCISLMNPQTDDAMALVAAHAFIKFVEVEGREANLFFSDRCLCGLALVNVLGRDCVMCKNAGALAINVLLDNFGGELVIDMLTAEVDGQEGVPAGQAFAKALMAAMTFKHAKTDDLTPAALRPFKWQPSQAQRCLLHTTCVDILQEAAKVKAAAEALVAEQVGSMLLQQIGSEKLHLAPMLADAYLLLVKTTNALQAHQQENPILLNDPNWLPIMMSFADSKFPEVQAASLQIFEQLLSQGIKLSPELHMRLADRVMAILEREPEDLFRPATFALAALLVCNPKEVSGHLLKQHPQTARLAASFAANKQPGSNNFLDVTERAAGATALEALLKADPVWAGLLLGQNPVTETHSGVAGDLIELLGYAYAEDDVTDLEVIKVTAWQILTVRCGTIFKFI
jgi:hypothetical protein